MPTKTHCHYCGHMLIKQHLEGRWRLYCTDCKQIIYENPIPATCLVVVNHSNQILLVKRNVEPQLGRWCLPGGFIECDEMPETAALRELKEETGLNGTIDILLGVRTTSATIYHSVLLICYLVRRFSGQAAAGDDAAAVQWIDQDHCPPLAFKSHNDFLNYFWGINQI